MQFRWGKDTQKVNLMEKKKKGHIPALDTNRDCYDIA